MSYEEAAYCKAVRTDFEDCQRGWGGGAMRAITYTLANGKGDEKASRFL
jgi:hypothetical protein